MNQDEDEILTSFFTLTNKVKDVLVVNRPELFEYVKNTDFRDPFGRYFQIVLYIGTNKRTTMTKFAEHFKLKAGTATGIIGQLVERNIISREANPKDRRKVELILTELGNAIFDKVIQIQKDEIRSVLDALNPQDLIHVKEIMDKINKALIIKEPTAKKPNE